MSVQAAQDLARKDLNRSERIVFEAIKAAARQGRPCPSNIDLTVMLDCSSLATPCKAVKGLEAKGYISVERYQHARTVAICGTSLSTAEPKHRTKHWRNRRRFTRAELEDHIADRMSEEVSFAAIAREIGFSVQHIRNVWADIRRQLGWQAV